jgi:hypothetical protein
MFVKDISTKAGITKRVHPPLVKTWLLHRNTR